MFGKYIGNEKRYFTINKVVIVLMAIVSFVISKNQILHPNVSVAIFAQNGVYSFFSIAFVPIVFGIFYKKVPKSAVISGSISALIIYGFIYYLLPGFVKEGSLELGVFDKYFTSGVQNPAIASHQLY
ncbi:MAG: hypothetical protein R2771_09105 [Saprospiraceae bacterium]